MRRRLLLFVFLGIVAVITGFIASRPETLVTSGVPTVEPENGKYSNIHPGDYVGPDTCAKCHSTHHENWLTHAHSKMNLNPSDATVTGDFSGEHLRYGDGEIAFEKEDDEFFMSLFSENTLSRRYRVTRTVGSRFTQMYIGLQTFGPEPEDHHAYHIEGKLPFGYWMGRNLWTPVSYFDSDYEPESDDGAAQTELLSHPQQKTKWEVNCLYCHNTYPYQHRLYFAPVLGFPREDFEFPGGAATVEDWGALTPDRLVTLGISCESCHYGGREHVEHGHPTRYYPSSPELNVAQLPSGDPTSHANVVNSICAQCHCAKVNLYPNGAGTWNSREALDLKSGACQQQVKCTDCHNPHRPGSDGGLFSEERITTKCIECHGEFQDETAVTSHTHHASGSVTCLDCHMPRIVQGLNSVIRTHHIFSPTDATMLRMSGPNACNLCHLDRSINWTVNALNTGWGQNLQTDSNWSNEYGDNLEKPVGQVWLNHSRPVMRLVVTDAFTRSPQSKQALPELLETLNEAYAVNRMFGLFAVEKILGRRLGQDEFNPLATQPERKTMVDALRERIREENEGPSAPNEN